MLLEMNWKSITKLAVEEQTLDWSEEIIYNNEHTPLRVVL